MAIWLFINAVRRHWWPLMSCAAFTFLAVWAAYFSRTNHWIVKASSVLTVLFLLIAFFFAWRDEHRKVNALKEQLGQAEKVYLDARPRMGINVIGEAGIKAWNEALSDRKSAWDLVMAEKNRRNSEMFGTFLGTAELLHS